MSHFRIFIFGFLLISIFSCKNEQKAVSDDILNIRLQRDAPSFNPILYPNLIGREIYTHLFLPLADINEKDLSLVPILIEEVPEIEVDSDGRYRLTVRVKSDAVWSDGTPISAEDILFTVKVIKHSLSSADQYRALLSPLSDVIVEELDSQKCTFVFNEYLLNLKESILSMEILPKHVLDPDKLSNNLSLQNIVSTEAENDSTYVKLGNQLNDPKWNHNLFVSSGPYKLVKFEENIETVIEKVVPYWGSKYDADMFQAKASKIMFTIIPDEVAALSELAAGNIDVVNGLSNQGYKSFIDTSGAKPNFKLNKGRLPRYYMLYLNHKSPFLSDVTVRKALRCLTDVDAYINTFEEGDGSKMSSFVPPFMPGYNANLQIESCAIDEARSLLAADGWQDTNQNAIVDKTINGKLQELKLIFYTSGELSQKIGLLLKDACEKVGIEIELIQKDFPLVMKENLSTGNYDIVPSVASTDILMENPYDWYHSDNIGSSNLSNYSNPEADKLIDIIRTAKDNTSLQKVFGQLQQIIYDDVAILYLYSPDQRIVVREPWEPVFTLKRPGYKANLFVSN
jgi:ABC-type transport system substrate-binding protein